MKKLLKYSILLLMSSGCTDCCQCCDEPESWTQDQNFPLAVLDSTGLSLIGPSQRFKLDSIYIFNYGDTLWLGETASLTSTLPFDSSFAVPLWVIHVPYFTNSSKVLRLSHDESDTIQMSFTSEQTKCTEIFHFEKPFVNGKEIDKDPNNYWYSYIID